MALTEADETRFAKHAAQDAEADAVGLEATTSSALEISFVILGGLGLEELVEDTFSAIGHSRHVTGVGKGVETHGENVLVGNQPILKKLMVEQILDHADVPATSKWRGKTDVSDNVRTNSLSTHASKNVHGIVKHVSFHVRAEQSRVRDDVRRNSSLDHLSEPIFGTTRLTRTGAGVLEGVEPKTRTISVRSKFK